MGIRESLLNTITSVGNGDFIRIVTSAGASSKATLANVFKSFESGLGAKSSLTASDYIRVVGSDNNAYKQSVSGVKDAMGVSEIALKTRPYTNIVSLETADLNTWRLPGIYIQNAWANVTSERHYPVEGTIGFLEVIAYPTDTERVMQRFTLIPSCDVYVRIRDYSGTWFDWVKQPTREEIDALNTKTPYIIGIAVGTAPRDFIKSCLENGKLPYDTAFVARISAGYYFFAVGQFYKASGQVYGSAIVGRPGYMCKVNCYADTWTETAI